MAESLPVLFQDDDLVVIHKPAGWLVHRTGLDAGETRFIVQTLRDQLGRHVFPVHRLDKGTSGVLVLALNSNVARELAQSFAQHAVTKDYIALVRGWPQQLQFSVDHALRLEDDGPDAPVQDAQTSFETLGYLTLPIPVDRYPSTRASLIAAKPLTGRRHQIRRHLKHVSHPIVGDSTHGKGPVNRWWANYLGVQRMWLHARSLSLLHPITRQPMRWESALCQPFNQDWQRLLTEDWTILADDPDLRRTTQ